MAHQLRDAFPDGQLFVNLRGAECHPAVPAEVLARFLRALGVDDSNVPDGLTERQEIYRNRLTRRRVGAWPQSGSGVVRDVWWPCPGGS